MPRAGLRSEAAEPQVPGDRGTSWVSRIPSAHSRTSNTLAFVLMLILGSALLGWYYTHAALRPRRTRELARAAAEKQLQGDTVLPPLGPLPPAPPAGARADYAPAQTGANPDDPAPAAPVRGSAAGELPQVPAPPIINSAESNAYPTSPRRVAVQHSEGDRRLSGPVFASAEARTAADPVSGTSLAGAAASVASAGSPPDAGLAASLHSEPAAIVHATVLSTQRWMLPKGAFIDCTLETAIDSTLPGMTTCVTSTDTFGVDGKVVLLERGTKLVGETRGQVQQGSARVFVIWTQARTPTGVLVPLDSPGTDELGRAGLPGAVDRHFWDRFGAAILISTIDGGIQAAVQSGARPGATTIINPSGATDVMTETLKGTLGIAPTIVKHNGDRIQVLVARDVDFSNVYQLHVADDAR
jgi:type IV secretion system protein VirB10